MNTLEKILKIIFGTILVIYVCWFLSLMFYTLVLGGTM